MGTNSKMGKWIVQAIGIEVAEQVGFGHGNGGLGSPPTLVSRKLGQLGAVTGLS